MLVEEEGKDSPLDFVVGLGGGAGSRSARSVGFVLAMRRSPSLWSGPRLACLRRRGPLLGAGTSIPFPLRRG